MHKSPWKQETNTVATRWDRKNILLDFLIVFISMQDARYLSVYSVSA